MNEQSAFFFITLCISRLDDLFELNDEVIGMFGVSEDFGTKESNDMVRDDIDRLCRKVIVFDA